MSSGGLRAGIVGCGGIARAHLAGYQATHGIDVAVVYDRSERAAAALAETAGLDVQVAASVEDMISRGLDAVSICTPPGAHFESCVPFVTAGVPVLCEKPLEKDADRAAQLAAAVRASDVVFMTAFCHRFHPPVAELKKLIDSGVLGKPLFFRSIFSGFMDLATDHRSKPELSGGGSMIDNGSHSVDLFRFLVGEPSAVVCMTGNVAQELPVEDCYALIVNADGRTFGELAASHSIPVGTNELMWYGTEGTAVVEYWDKLSYQVRGEDWVDVECDRTPDRFVREIRHFVQCIRAGATPSVTVGDGLAVSRIISAAYESAASGRALELAPDERLGA